MAPPEEMLVGRKDTRPFYNFTLFATSMKFFKIRTWHSGKKPKLFQTSMPPCACHGLVFPSREGQPQWIFLLFPAKRTQKRGPRHLGRATCDFICALISASKWRLALFFMTRVHQVFYDPTGFLCPENGDSSLASRKSWTWIQIWDKRFIWKILNILLA